MHTNGTDTVLVPCTVTVDVVVWMAIGADTVVVEVWRVFCVNERTVVEVTGTVLVPVFVTTTVMLGRGLNIVKVSSTVVVT